MPQARVLVCERGEGVVLAVRRALAGLPVRTLRTVTPPDARRELAQRPRSVAVVEVTERSLDATLELIAWARSQVDLRLVAVLERGLEDYELLVRELGAASAVVSARDLSQIRGLVERHLLGPARIARQEGFAESFGHREAMRGEALARLPWDD